MPRETLDRKIRRLMDEILVLNSLIEEATLQAVEALSKHDLEAARQVVAGDSVINAKRYVLENDTIITIATQQPIMAGDLRLLSSILEVAGELERMGDYAKGIAKVCLNIGLQPHLRTMAEIPRMAEITLGMVHRAVGAFVSRNAEAARQIPADDDQVDELYNTVYRELTQAVVVDISAIDNANYLMWAAHDLERMADRVSNICERTIYVATARLEELDHPNSESSRHPTQL